MNTNTNSPLGVEIGAFEKRRKELEALYPRKFVVFKGVNFVGAWDTLNAAAVEAVERFGRGPYLIRQVGVPLLRLPVSVRLPV